MTGLDDLILEEYESLVTLENMLDDNDDIDCFISDGEYDSMSNEICPMCGRPYNECECEYEDDDEIYYDEQALAEAKAELDDAIDDFF